MAKNKEFRVGQKIRCTDAEGARGYLVYGEVYKIRSIGATYEDLYLEECGGGWMKDRFEVVGCPCQVPNCIRHRKNVP